MKLMTQIKPACGELADAPMFVLPTLETMDKFGQWLNQRFDGDLRRRCAAFDAWFALRVWLDCKPQNYFSN